MEIVSEISEDEFVAAFLKMEIDSERFGNRYLPQIEKDGRDRKIVDNPDCSNKEENEYRKFLLGKARGYKINKFLFVNFPNEVKWFRAKLTKEDLRNSKFLKYSYWIKVSNGSRKAADAAKTIKSGVEIFGQSNEIYFNAAEAIKSGVKMPELIFVGKNKESQLVLLEGHVRLTSYFLAYNHIPEPLDCIVGFSPNISKWIFY